MPFPIVSAGSDEYALKASLPPLTAIITSPRRSGPMTPVTRPTRPIISWSSTVRTILPPSERSGRHPGSRAVERQEGGVGEVVRGADAAAGPGVARALTGGVGLVNRAAGGRE